MFSIKICGITTVEDAQTVAAAGADAIGLNFFADSPRCVGLDVAAAIVRATPARVRKVGLFVNTDLPAIERTWQTVGFDLVQLHGDETPEFVAELGVRRLPPVVRAFRLSPLGLPPIVEYVEKCRRLGNLPAAVLVDAFVPGSFGGTGRRADWAALAAYHACKTLPPLVLAGGLTADNVAEAIRQVRPHAVDVASGVESTPARKDPAKVRAFVQAARSALGAIK
ncbi:MAG: phosphoribosylanthranilate isomerase [Pirellulales bacterium]|nr:phosphoribosylanthranilate isomerase [Pirellulales bacterium]